MSSPAEGQFKRHVELDPGAAEDATRRLRGIALATGGLEALGVMINRGLTDSEGGDRWMNNYLASRAAGGIQGLADYASKQCTWLADLLGISEESLLPLPPTEPEDLGS